MNSKTYTLALMQVMAFNVNAIRISTPHQGDTLPDPNGNMSGFLHVTGVTHGAGSGNPSLQRVDDIYHVDGFYKTLADAQAAIHGGDHGGDNHQCPSKE